MSGRKSQTFGKQLRAVFAAGSRRRARTEEARRSALETSGLRARGPVLASDTTWEATAVSYPSLVRTGFQATATGTVTCSFAPPHPAPVPQWAPFSECRLAPHPRPSRHSSNPSQVDPRQSVVSIDGAPPSAAWVRARPPCTPSLCSDAGSRPGVTGRGDCHCPDPAGRCGLSSTVPPPCAARCSVVNVRPTSISIASRKLIPYLGSIIFLIHSPYI